MERVDSDDWEPKLVGNEAEPKKRVASISVPNSTAAQRVQGALFEVLVRRDRRLGRLRMDKSPDPANDRGRLFELDDQAAVARALATLPASAAQESISRRLLKCRPSMTLLARKSVLPARR